VTVIDPSLPCIGTFLRAPAELLKIDIYQVMLILPDLQGLLQPFQRRVDTEI
jgi:hypothetical protein